MAINSNRRPARSGRRNYGFSTSSYMPSTRRMVRRGFGHTTIGSIFGGHSTWNRPSVTRSTRTNAGRSGGFRHGGSSTNYRTIASAFEQKINSFKTLYAQTAAAAGNNRPSPATLNTLAKWVNKGAVVQRVAPNQIARWGGTARSVKTPNTAKAILCQKFGKSAIKAVTCDKSGGFLVATSPTHKGKTIKFPNS